MTEAEFSGWLLDDSAKRCVLVEAGVKVGGVETTRYLSNKGYKGSVFYEPLIVGGMDFTEIIELSGDFSFNLGDIELNNMDGGVDSWAEDVWDNRPINIFVGDVRWPRNEFVQVFSGLCGGIDVRDRGTLNLKVVDKLQKLNTSTSEVKLGGTTPNADKLIPVCIGEPHNITPLLHDVSLSEYVFHIDETEQVTEVRDNGVPVLFTDVGFGKFRLTQAAYGVITASVQGAVKAAVGGFVRDVPSAIRYIVQHLVPDANKLSDSEIDLDNFEQIRTALPYRIGVYLADKTNALALCNSLAQSIGCRLVTTAEGKIRLVEVTPVRVGLGTVVTTRDMRARSLRIEELHPVVAAIKLGYAKNFTVQQNVSAGIPSSHAELYNQEWLTVSRESSSVIADYKYPSDTTMRETFLVAEADAISQANKELTWKSVRRKTMMYEGYANLLTERVGDTQTLVHGRFGLSSGVSGQIIYKRTDWLAFKVEIGVLI